MHIRKRVTAAALCAFAVFVFMPEESGAQRVKSSNKAGEQRKAEKGLRDNRYFIYFINSSVTNYGTDDQKKVFREIIQRDLMSQILYLKFMFYESFVEIRKSQRKLIDIYREILRSDIDMSKKMLDAFAPAVISSEDPLAREYLRLGYRETINTSIEMGMGDNYRPTLYSMRLYKYVKAVKRIKEAKKYGFYALIRARMTKEEKAKFKTITYDDIDARLGDIVPKEEIDRFKLMNCDAFYKVQEKATFFDTIWQNPELDTLPDFRKYMNSDN